MDAAAPAGASSLREAPFNTPSRKVDGTDFYMFRSYDAGRADYVTLIANYVPLQDAYGGPNYFAMDPNALYEIHVDNNGDAKEDLTFQFRFTNTLANGGAGVTLPIGGKNVAIPLVQAGAVANVRDASLNLAERFSLTVVRGDRRTGTAAGHHTDKRKLRATRKHQQTQGAGLPNRQARSHAQRAKALVTRIEKKVQYR